VKAAERASSHGGLIFDDLVQSSYFDDLGSISTLG